MANTDMVVTIKHAREMRLRFAIARILLEIGAWLIGAGMIEIVIEDMDKAKEK